MNNITSDNYLEIIKIEMMVESLETVDKGYIKNIVLRAGGKDTDIDNILRHPSVKEIETDLFYIKR